MLVIWVFASLASWSLFSKHTHAISPDFEALLWNVADIFESSITDGLYPEPLDEFLELWSPPSQLDPPSIDQNLEHDQQQYKHPESLGSPKDFDGREQSESQGRVQQHPALDVEDLEGLTDRFSEDQTQSDYQIPYPRSQYLAMRHKYLRNNPQPPVVPYGLLAKPTLDDQTSVPGDFDTNFSQCGSRHEYRIGYGKSARLGQLNMPYIAVKSFEDDSELFCGAVLVSETIALTAAHCIYNETDFKQDFYAFDPAFGQERPINKARNVCVHKNFSLDVLRNSVSGSGSALLNDFAVITFIKPFNLDTLWPACLPSRPLSKGDACDTVGTDTGYIGRKLHAFHLPVRQTTCPALMRHRSHICFTAVDENRPGSVCAGDSGGPVLCEINGRIEVHGLVSSSSNTCGSGYSPDLYFDVFRNRASVQKLIEECDAS